MTFFGGFYTPAAQSQSPFVDYLYVELIAGCLLEGFCFWAKACVRARAGGPSLRELAQGGFDKFEWADLAKLWGFCTGAISEVIAS